jgi:glyoxylase-like metal-dependent hydrolase (beta-lactamase superfamily II)
MEEISRGIFYENAYSGVTLGAVLLPQGAILLDAPLRAEEGRSWRATLNNAGASPNRVLVNLDAHPDRTLGARAMDCTIIAHQKTAQVFRTRPSVFKGQNAESGSEWEAYDEAVGTRWAVPDITFTQHLLIHWGPYPVILEQHPGPMPGAIWVILPEAKVIFVGDAVLENQPPFLTNANLDEWIESLDLLTKAYKTYTIISGRGGVVPFEAVRTQKKHLKHIQKEIQKTTRYKTEAEGIEAIIPSILKDLHYTPHMEEQFVQRLRHGLLQYYTHHYDLFDNQESDF